MTTVTSLPRIYRDEHPWKHKELTARLDLVRERTVLIEAKAGQDIDSREQKPLRNSLGPTEIEVGRLFNFRATTPFGRYGFENDGKNRRNSRQSMDKTSPGSCG